MLLYLFPRRFVNSFPLPKKGETVDNIKAAKAKLVRQKEESSLKGLGYIQCITGYAIEVQEEQLKGKFYIKSVCQLPQSRYFGICIAALKPC